MIISKRRHAYIENAFHQNLNLSCGPFSLPFPAYSWRPLCFISSSSSLDFLWKSSTPNVVGVLSFSYPLSSSTLSLTHTKKHCSSSSFYCCFALWYLCSVIIHVCCHAWAQTVPVFYSLRFSNSQGYVGLRKNTDQEKRMKEN